MTNIANSRDDMKSSEKSVIKGHFKRIKSKYSVTKAKTGKRGYRLAGYNYMLNIYLIIFN